MDFGIEKRNLVLKTSLYIEKTTSVFLGSLLGIKDVESSKTLGNKSSSISFNNKVDLLIDIGALKPETKKKFQHFMEIRNQFMHNLSATSYIKCLDNLKGTEKSLLKIYPQKKGLEKEEELEGVITDLCNDVAKIALDITAAVKKKFEQDSLMKIYKKSQEAMVATFDDVSSTFDDYFNKLTESQRTISPEEFEDFGTELRTILFGVWRKKFKELIEE
ncbi:MAG: hypothetical protein JJU13_08370 [Balneolaceae bacterium]|nr:hypothetical protein [Balneolaceae bacterium]